MKNKAQSTVKNKFFSIITFILLCIICVSASVVLVWPLWKFSISCPKVYTVIVLSLIGIAVLYFIIKKIRNSSLPGVIKVTVNCMITFSGLFFCIKLVLLEKQVFSLLLLLLTIGLLIFFNLIINKVRHE